MKIHRQIDWSDSEKAMEVLYMRSYGPLPFPCTGRKGEVSQIEAPPLTPASLLDSRKIGQTMLHLTAHSGVSEN